MTAKVGKQPKPSAVSASVEMFEQVRAQTMQIVAPLEIEDYVVQTAEFMSPPRWHIGHTSWFFETLLERHLPGYQIYSEEYLFYFNSYYEGFGPRIPRPKRGTRSRPTVKETLRYRRHVDQSMLRLFAHLEDQPGAETILSLVRLGLEHEMQHQELLVYDIKHLLCEQYAAPRRAAPSSSETVRGLVEIEGGLFSLGYAGEGFAFDNEKPSHQVYLQDFAIARAPVSNAEFLEFIQSGGYRDYRWWHAEGWDTVLQEQWQAPLYWELHGSEWMIRDFAGLHRVGEKTSEPVSHVSFYEASAFAKWAGKRLPTEAEWDKAACFDPSKQEKQSFPWGDAEAEVLQANLFENQWWGVAPIGSLPQGRSV